MKNDISNKNKNNKTPTLQMNLRVPVETKEKLEWWFNYFNRIGSSYVSRGQVLTRVLKDSRSSDFPDDAYSGREYFRKRQTYSRRIWDEMPSEERLDFLEYAKESYGDKIPVIFNRRHRNKGYIKL